MKISLTHAISACHRAIHNTELIIRYRKRVLVAVLVLAWPSMGYTQGPPQSPIDSTVNGSDVVSTTPAQKAAALNTMFTWIESTLGPALNMNNPRQEWTAKAVEKDNSNRWNITINQVFSGVPVKDGHLNIVAVEGSSGEPEWHGAYMDQPQVDTKPKLHSQHALKAVEKMVKEAKEARKAKHDKEDKDKSQKALKNLIVGENNGWSTSQLEIHPADGPGHRKLTYHVSMADFSGGEPMQVEAWVDQEGNVIEFFENLQTANINGQGRTLYQGTQGLGFGSNFFKVDAGFGGFVLNDEVLRIGTYRQSGGTVYQNFSGNTIFGNFATSNINSSSADVHWSTVQTNSYMFYILARNWVNGSGGPRKYAGVDGLGTLITAINHVGTNYNNAYWDGEKINVGDGDGSRFSPLASLDVIGHEWFHGVTQFNGRGGLTYMNESGAANESFSDIFGCMTERYWQGEPGGIFGTTWQVGEKCFTPGTGGDALRYMYRPTFDGVSRDYYPARYVGTGDNGGVHFNSGIQNNAFWLLATGGSHRVTGAMSGGIGADKATRIFYKYLTAYALPNDNFHFVRVYTIYAAGVLYGFGSNEYNRTIEAWNKVGVP